MKKVLVTGGSGLVGSHLKEVMPDAVYISSKDYDLTSEAAVKELCKQGWDNIIHLAARVGGIIDHLTYPAEFIEQNLLINTLLLKYARLNNVPRVTAILSTCIYPDVFETYPMVEEDLHDGKPQASHFGYAIAKRSLAVQIDAYNKQFQTKYNYLIPCNLYGEFDKFDEEKSHYLTALIGKLIKAERDNEKVVNLLGTGKPFRQVLYAGDLASVIKYCIENDITESFNVATDDNLSIRQIAETALKACGLEDLELVFDHSKPDGQFRKDVSNARMRKIMPDFQFTSWETGIRQVYQYYKNNNIV